MDWSVFGKEERNAIVCVVFFEDSCGEVYPYVDKSK